MRPPMPQPACRGEHCSEQACRAENDSVEPVTWFATRLGPAAGLHLVPWPGLANMQRDCERVWSSVRKHRVHPRALFFQLQLQFPPNHAGRRARFVSLPNICAPQLQSARCLAKSGQHTRLPWGPPWSAHHHWRSAAPQCEQSRGRRR